MEKLRVGIVGGRGESALAGIRSSGDADVVAFCEKDEKRLNEAAQKYSVPLKFTDYEEMLPYVDAVVVATPMHLHVAQSIAALKAGKHVLSEVTAAVSLEECWRLLDAAHSSSGIYMLAENYCYRYDTVLVREMARKGFFGELYFGEGEYIHDVRNLHHNIDGTPTWRYFWQVGQNGNTYITHELGPVMHWFTAADPTERIESVICLGSGRHTDTEHPHDDTSITLVKLRSGKLIKVRLDMLSNRPGAINYSLQGTRGAYELWGDGKPRVWIGNEANGGLGDGAHDRKWQPLADFDEHLAESWRTHQAAAAQAGHGGGDFHVARLFVEAIVNGKKPDIDIYDALEWTAAGLCTQISIANNGAAVKVPDFRDPTQRPVWLDGR